MCQLGLYFLWPALARKFREGKHERHDRQTKGRQRTRDGQQTDRDRHDPARHRVCRRYDPCRLSLLSITSWERKPACRVPLPTGGSKLAAQYTKCKQKRSKRVDRSAVRALAQYEQNFFNTCRVVVCLSSSDLDRGHRAVSMCAATLCRARETLRSVVHMTGVTDD